MGFAGLSVPTGYGSVSLTASINGINLGDAWSKKTAYTKGTEHAEDAVVDLVEQIEAAVDLPNIGGFSTDLDPAVLQSVRNRQLSGQPCTLVIDNLTASPCSRLRGTCDKPDMVGCADRLIELTIPAERRSWRPRYQESSFGRPIRVPPPTPQSNQPGIQPGITWAITINADHYYQPQGVEGAKQKSAAAVQDMRQAGIIVNIRRT
jgi:hypothetical protein